MKKSQELLNSAIDISERMNLTVVEFERVMEKIADKTLDSAIAIEAFASQIDGVANVVSNMPMTVNTLRDSIIDAEVRIANTPEIQIPEGLGELNMPLVGNETPAEIPKRNLDEVQDAALKIADTFDKLVIDLSNSKLGISGFDTTAAGFEGATLEDMPDRLREFDDVMRLSLDELMYNVEDETKRIRDNFNSGSMSSEEYDAAMAKIRESDALIDSMLENLGGYTKLAAGIELIMQRHFKRRVNVLPTP
jgi:hypothetical protein